MVITNRYPGLGGPTLRDLARLRLTLPRRVHTAHSHRPGTAAADPQPVHRPAARNLATRNRAVCRAVSAHGAQLGFPGSARRVQQRGHIPAARSSIES